jgi:DNA-directed RNA polymerase subunit RPC12/RpoP
MAKSNSDKSKKVVTTQSMAKCPHCGVKLSSWEQVLLNVDRALMCKNCWYRIILDVGKSGESDHHKSEEKQ